MKKIDFKKVLAFIIVPLILTYFALDYLDYNAKTNSLIFFDALYNVNVIFVLFGALYILCGVWSLFTRSVKAGVFDFIEAGLLFFTAYLINDILLHLATLFLILSGIWSIVNCFASGKEQKERNTVLEEFGIALVVIIVIGIILFAPIIHYFQSVERDSELLLNEIKKLESNASDEVNIRCKIDYSKNRKLYTSLLDKDLKKVISFGPGYYYNSFITLKNISDNKRIQIGIIMDGVDGKCYIVNDKGEKILKIEGFDDVRFSGTNYLLDLVENTINKGLLNYKVEEKKHMDDTSNNYYEVDFDGNEFEDDGKEYYYFENSHNNNILIQLAVGEEDNTSHEFLTSTFELFNLSFEELYYYEREYYLINKETKTKIKLNCDNLLIERDFTRETINNNSSFDKLIFAFSDGSIPFYDENEHGYFDLDGEKHVDLEGKTTIDIYEKYVIEYDSNNMEYYIYEKENLEKPIKKYKYIYTTDDFAICYGNNKFDILSSEDLHIIKSIPEYEGLEYEINDEELEPDLDIEVYNNNVIIINDKLLYYNKELDKMDIYYDDLRTFESIDNNFIYNKNSFYLDANIF